MDPDDDYEEEAAHPHGDEQAARGNGDHGVDTAAQAAPPGTGAGRTTHTSTRVSTEHGDPSHNPPLPPYLKDISFLATWTVSSHKPGCGVQSLRHPSPTRFWQSDGPQPHYLNIHFFKLVNIAHIRVFLDHEQDESYTPTKLQFLAGTGYHDLTEVCIMKFEQPKGWLDVDLSEAGGPDVFANDEMSEARRQHPRLGPTLRCMLVQLRILENHQNGKDTHLRGLQLFSLDESAVTFRRKPASALVNPDAFGPTGPTGPTSRIVNDLDDQLGPAVRSLQHPNALPEKAKFGRPGRPRRRSSSVERMFQSDMMQEPSLR